jgi:hypothetical protein
MSRHLFRIIALVLAMGLQSQVVRAQDNSWNWLFGHQDPRLTATGIVVGLGTEGEYLALRRRVTFSGQRIHPITVLGAYTLATGACAALFPIVGTIWLNRPLTPREVYMGMADCVVPFIGGWWVDAVLPHTAWYDGTPAPVVYRHHHHHYK